MEMIGYTLVAVVVNKSSFTRQNTMNEVMVSYRRAEGMVRFAGLMAVLVYGQIKKVVIQKMSCSHQ